MQYCVYISRDIGNDGQTKNSKYLTCMCVCVHTYIWHICKRGNSHHLYFGMSAFGCAPVLLHLLSLFFLYCCCSGMYCIKTGK